MSFYGARSNGLNSHWARHYPQSPFAHRHADEATEATTDAASSPPPVDPPRRVVRVPPPAYAPGNTIPLTQTSSSGSTLQRSRSRWGSSGSSASSVVVQVHWLDHPALSLPMPWLRRLPRFLRKRPEALDDRWPSDFARAAVLGMGAGTVRDSDSGIALTNASDNEAKLAASYSDRVTTLNDVVAAYLVPTRFVLALLELLNIVWIVLLIVALGVTGGKQVPFLEGVEVALVGVILLNAGFYNNIRLRRWRLARKLRQFSVDWSPLPMTSSTARGLVASYAGQTEADVEASGESTGSNEAAPALRWSIYGTEGGFWTAYRPIVRVELLMPSSRWFASPPAEAPAAAVHEDLPIYSKDAATDDAPVVNVLPSG